MNNQAEILKDLLLDQVKVRILEEGIPRIKKCLSELSDTNIWHRPNDHLVSVGNLILHLCGNVRQWLIAGLGRWPDYRDRDSEFNERGPLPVEYLIEQLDHLERDVEKVLPSISLSQLQEEKIIQGIFHETGLSICVHVMEHFSYHVGQITYYTKWVKNKDLAYYGDQDLSNTAD